MGPVDSAIASAIGVTRGSERLAACLKTLRTERSVVVFYRTDSRAGVLVAQITGVLSWPRQAWLIALPAESADGRVGEAIARDPAGLFFIGVSPLSGLGRPVEVGGGILFVRREEESP